MSIMRDGEVEEREREEKFSAEKSCLQKQRGDSMKTYKINILPY